MWNNRRAIINVKNITLSLYIALCVALLFITLISSFINPLGLYDEGFSLTNALRILQGEVPHLDYWTAYPPGTSLTLATFFRIFEPTLFVARLTNLGWTILLLGAIFVLLRHISSIWLSLAATIITSLWISASLPPSYSVIPALAITFTSLVFFVKGIAFCNKKFSTIGGIIAGIIVLFRHDFAGYLFLSILLSLIISRAKLKHKTKSFGIKNTQFFLGSFLLTTLSVLALLLAHSDWNNFFQQAIEFPATGMKENRLLPYPGLLDFFGRSKAQWLLAWLVPLIIVVSITNQWILRIKQNFFESMATHTLAMMSLLLTLQAHNRLDMTHVAPSIIFTLCFLIALAAKKANSEPIINKITSHGLIGLFFVYSILVSKDHINYDNVLQCVQNPADQSCMQADRNQVEIVEYINEHYNITDYVFVGNTRHDKIFVNDASLYFLLKRPIPVKWNEMHPGIVTTSEVQELMIKQLDTKNVKIIVLAEMPAPKEMNASAISSEVYLLDDYIDKNYRTIFSNEQYKVLERKPNFMIVK